MKTVPVNIKLYYLLTHADGEVHEKEKEVGEKMLWHEAKSKDNFNEQLSLLEQTDNEVIFEESINELRKFDKNDQINCLAWMCLIANADGFMDKNEWQLIYDIYHKKLSLNLSEITARQKELHQFIRQYRNIPDASAHTNLSPDIKKKPSVKFNEDSDKPGMAFPM